MDDAIEQPRFRDEAVVFAGVAGEHVAIDTANPGNYHEAITAPSACEPVTIDGKLFLPSDERGQPAVIMVPGSLGVGPNHRAHSESLVTAGHAVLVLDPFGARSVESTIANQTPYSFAASAFDVLAALHVLREHPLIDADRINAQGHSRGGSAVLTAATRRFAEPIVGADVGLAGVYAAYPWCGHQFVDPSVGGTKVRAILGEVDEWCSVQQAQAQVHAMALSGGDASVRIVAGAAHSFDRLEDVHELEEAVVAPHAPTIFLTHDGSMIDPHTNEPDPELTDLEVFVAAAKAGFARQGASIGRVGDQPALFEADMLEFHTAG
jgi:dienelactone hydrolase